MGFTISASYYCKADTGTTGPIDPSYRYYTRIAILQVECITMYPPFTHTLAGVGGKRNTVNCSNAIARDCNALLIG
jgi:hypothetical protein